MNHFENFIKCSCKIDILDNKKHLSGLMKNWINIEVSHYNGEDNFMILTGLKNSITVIDLDVSKHESDTNSITWFEEHLGKLSDINTLVTQTISGGYHIYFKYCADLKTTTKLNGIPLDILNDNKGVLEGKGYTVVNSCDIRELSVDELTHFKPEIKSVLEINNSQSHSELQMRKILNGLSLTRFDERDSWIRIGYILSQYTFGEKLFKEFSKKSSKYDEATHDQQWNSLNSESSDTTVTIATLLMWLKTDNKELFEIVNNEQKIIKELNNSVIKTNYKITSNEVVKMKNNSIDLMCDYDTMALLQLHTLSSKKCNSCDLQAAYTNSGFLMKCTNCSFSYPDTPIVIPKTDNSMIYNVLNQICINNENIKNKDTFPVAERIIEEWNETVFYDPKLDSWLKYNNKNGLYEKKSDANITKEIRDITKNLKNSDYDEVWFEWISKISYTKLLIEDIKTNCEKDISYDQHKFLLGFNNGVYDLEKSCFRIGKKEEFITMKCNYEYNENYNTDLAKKVLDITFINEEEKIFAINRLTLCLEGLNREQTMTFNYGFSAANGKSFLMERMKKALGDYAGFFPVNLLTNKMKAAGDANTVLLKFKNKRFMYCSEPESNCKINVNFLKQITGDSITARALYSNEEEEFDSSANIFMCCNRLPELDGDDEGIIRRIRFLEFKSKFVKDPKNKNEQQMIKYSDEEIKNIEIGLMHLLIENYKKLQEKNFDYPEPNYFYDIRNLYTNENKNDIKDILDEHFEIGDENDFVKKSEIKEVLKLNKIKMRDADLERFIESLYDCEFKKQKHIACIIHSRIFMRLKKINND
jgi:phage/plasmid-associated DNA primase